MKIVLTNNYKKFKILIYGFVISSSLLGQRAQWSTTSFEYLWNRTVHRMTFREPISFSPFGFNIGYFEYGGNDFWDKPLSFKTKYNANPAILDSTTSSFDILSDQKNRLGLYMELDLFKINITNYIFHQNFFDIQFGLGYRASKFLTSPKLPSNEQDEWDVEDSDGFSKGLFRYNPLINDINFNTTITFQPINPLIFQFYHSIGRTNGSLYKSTGGQNYLSGDGYSESYSIALKVPLRNFDFSYDFFVGLEAKWIHTKMEGLIDEYDISPINDFNMKSFSYHLTFGTMFGGERTIGDDAFLYMLDNKYEKASQLFNRFINSFPKHGKVKKARKMINFCESQIPYEYFDLAINYLNSEDINNTIKWLKKSEKNASDDLIFEIESIKKDIAFSFLDSIHKNKDSMPIQIKESLLRTIKELAPNLKYTNSMDADFLIEKADKLVRLGNYLSAIKYYKLSESNYPKSAPDIKQRYKNLNFILQNKSQEYIKKGNLIVAIQILKQILMIDTENQDAINIEIKRLNKAIFNHQEKDRKKYMDQTLRKYKNIEESKSDNILQLGMSFHQVEQIMGVSNLKDTMEAQGVSYEMWTYKKENSIVKLYFENYKLVKIE